MYGFYNPLRHRHCEEFFLYGFLQHCGIAIANGSVCDGVNELGRVHPCTFTLDHASSKIARCVFTTSALSMSIAMSSENEKMEKRFP